MTTVGLCRDHCNILYTQLHASATCESCGAKPKKGECFNRCCPAPDSVNMYLSLLTSDPSHLTNQSLICIACYKHFHQMLKNIQQGTGLKQYVTSVSKEAAVNRNHGIDQVIARISSKMTSIREDGD